MGGTPGCSSGTPAQGILAPRATPLELFTAVTDSIPVAYGFEPADWRKHGGDQIQPLYSSLPEGPALSSASQMSRSLISPEELQQLCTNLVGGAITNERQAHAALCSIVGRMQGMAAAAPSADSAPSAAPSASSAAAAGSSDDLAQYLGQMGELPGASQDQVSLVSLVSQSGVALELIESL